ncbi:MAG TPA: serine hydrolase domain-containing protein [Pirellulales bacterium]|nr:serine hydrolase domain-containing protein [Pirellulales bacterium]
MYAQRHNRRQFIEAAAAGVGVWTIGIQARAQDGTSAARSKQPVDALPMTGIGAPQLAAYDKLMLSFMREHTPPGAALAVTKAGRLVYARGFGHADRERHEPVEPTSLFRIASLGKSLSSAAIFQLVEKGRLKLDAKVFGLLRISPYLAPGAKIDPRLREVTVLDCLHHAGGWDRDKGFDPMGADAAEQIAKALKIGLPIRPEHIIRYTFGRRLDFDPGKAFAYSNFGYCVLGRVIEEASGQRYGQYLQKEVLAPLGIRRMKLGKNLLIDRAPGEVRYYDSTNRIGRAISGPRIGQQAPLPYGVECIETMDANGGWIASAVELLRFTSSLDDPRKCPVLSEKSIREIMARPGGVLGYAANGKPKPDFYGCGWEVRPANVERGKWTKWHTGGLAGSSTLMVCRNDDIDWVVLFNCDATRDGKAFADIIDPLLHGPADQIKNWPEGDLFDKLLAGH